MNTVINRDVLLDGSLALVIGDNVSVSEGTVILTQEHDLDSPSFANSGATADIGDRVFIRARAIMLPGVKVSESGVGGAGAVVIHNVRPCATVRGVPARVIGEHTYELSYILDYRKILG